MSIPFDGTGNAISSPIPKGQWTHVAVWIKPARKEMTWDELMRQPVRVWDHALSNEEIARIYQDCKRGLYDA